MSICNFEKTVNYLLVLLIYKCLYDRIDVLMGKHKLGTLACRVPFKEIEDADTDVERNTHSI